MSSIGQTWLKLTSIGRVIREMDRGGKQTSERSYYIRSIAAKMGVFSDNMCEHWGIENGLHWFIGVVFGEDHRWILDRNVVENMSFLRRIVTTLLNCDTSKSSLKQKRKEATWDTSFLKPRQGGLACEIIVIGKTIGHQFEDSIATQGIMIVLIFISGEDDKHTATHYLQ